MEYFKVLLHAICLVIGGVITFGTLIFGIAFLFQKLIEFVQDKIIWKHKYKNRFNKPPTAKCYCIDCKYYKKKRNL